MFKIKSIYCATHDNSYGGYKWKCIVSVDVDAKYWAKAKKDKQLGALYGVDIGNSVYAINNNIPAHNPMVSDSKNAKKGIKNITLTYHFNDADKAEKLGLKVIRLKSGEVISSFGDYVQIELPKDNFIYLNRA